MNKFPKNRIGREWEEFEIELLRDCNSRGDLVILAELLGRSYFAVRCKRYRLLGNTASKVRMNSKSKYYEKHRRGKINSVMKKQWEEWEDEFVLSPDSPRDVVLSRILGRSVQAIQVRRSNLFKRLRNEE